MPVDDECVGQIRELQVSDAEDEQEGVGIVVRQVEDARRLLGPVALGLLGPVALGIKHGPPYGAGEAHGFG